jgi:hypothetical protein
MHWIQGQSKIFTIQVTKGSRKSRGIALLILNPVVDGIGWSTSRLDRFTPAKKTTRCEYQARRAPEHVWTICRREKCLVAGGIRSLDRPARIPVTTPSTLSRNLGKHRTYVNKHEFSKMYCSLRHATEERTENLGFSRWCTTLLWSCALTPCSMVGGETEYGSSQCS